MMNRTAMLFALATGVGGVLPSGVVAQPVSRPPRFRGMSFVLARFSSTGTLAGYGARAIGSVSALVGVVHNSRTGAQVVMAGIGTRARLTGWADIAVFGAMAGGTGGATARLYMLPSARVGRWTLSGTAAAQLPLEAPGRWKLSVDPMALSYNVTPALGLGLATVLRRQATGSVVLGGGPAASWRVLGIRTTGELVRLSGSGRFEAHLASSIPF